MNAIKTAAAVLPGARRPTNMSLPSVIFNDAAAATWTERERRMPAPDYPQIETWGMRTRY